MSATYDCLYKVVINASSRNTWKINLLNFAHSANISTQGQIHKKATMKIFSILICSHYIEHDLYLDFFNFETDSMNSRNSLIFQANISNSLRPSTLSIMSFTSLLGNEK